MNIYKIIKFKISLIILLQIFYKISFAKSFDYPYSITLANDNIFLIQKTGIDIYDKSLNMSNQIIKFSKEEEITDENFAKIALKNNKDYILSIINDKFFIFNNEGKLLYKNETKINDNQIIYSYSLTLIYTTNEACYYIIGYFDENSYLNLFLYRYDNIKNKIALLSEYKGKNYLNQITESTKDNFLDYNPKLLSCEYMYYNVQSKRFLVCFFNSGDTVRIMFYDINNDIFIYEDSYIENYKRDDDYKITLNTCFSKNLSFIPTENIDKNKYIVSIKTEISNDIKKAIIWWNLEGDNQTRYLIYSLYYMKDLYSSKMPNACINSKYEPRINVFPYKDQITFSCTMEDENIQIVLYNKTDLMNNFYIKNISCENNNELSKLYFNDNKNYLIYPCLNQKREGENEEENKGENGEENKGENEEENKGGNEEEKKRENEEEKKRENEEEKKRENEEEKKRENEKENKGENEKENKGENEKENKIVEKEKEKEKEDKTVIEENKKINIIMIIIIIAIIITLLIVFIIIFRKYRKKNDFEKKWKKGKENENLMKDILSELLPNKSIKNI